MATYYFNIMTCKTVLIVAKIMWFKLLIEPDPGVFLKLLKMHPSRIVVA